MARNDPQVNLRMPSALKDALDAAAELNKRSLTAEIIARLDASLSEPTAPRETMAQYLEAQIQAVQNRLTMLDMRGEMVRSRLDGLDVRARLISQDSERFTREAKTDADFARAEESIEQFKAVQRDAEAQVRELDAIVRERNDLLKQIDGMKRHVGEAREAIEARVRDGLESREAKRQGSLNKVILVGNLGRDPAVREFPVAGSILNKVMIEGLGSPKKPPNKGPTRSPNARKPKPR